MHIWMPSYVYPSILEEVDSSVPEMQAPKVVDFFLNKCMDKQCFVHQFQLNFGMQVASAT